MTDFWKSDTARIVKAMKAGGNQSGLIALWKAFVEAWANTNAGPDAEAAKAWLPAWQTRALYTADELAPIFPALAVAFKFSERMTPQKSPARLRNELIFAGLPHRVIGGKLYFAVERLHFWRDTVDAAWEEEISNAHDG